MRKRLAIKLLVGVTVFGGVFAMAATLGGVGSATLGADSGTVSSCDSDGVTTAYTSGWDATDKRYEVSAVTVSGVADACDGLTLGVTLTDSSGAKIGDGTVTVPTELLVGTATVTLSTAPASSAVTGVHVSIG